jgi:hypothetical protein
MTFLEMCQMVASDCGISGSIASVVGRVGDHGRVVSWVNRAWFEIQRSNTNWDWMRYDFTFNTVASDGEYTPAEANTTDFSKWHTDTFRIFKTATGVSDEQFLPYTDYKSFRDTYLYGTQTPSRPSVAAIRPRGSNLLLGVLPDGIYTVTGEYQRKPVYMAANTDVPAMPDEYHLGIVHKAKIKYAMFANAPEVLAQAQDDYDYVMADLTELQLPDLTTGNPLA